MKENAKQTKFRLTKKEGRFWVGVKPVDEEHRCEGCMFRYLYRDYSCGYGFATYGCRLGTARNAMCLAESRTDKTDIVYVNLGKISEP